jgi:hypothetical protein
VVIAQLWFHPAASAPNRICGATRTGALWPVASPTPSCPFAFEPQQRSSPPADSPQLCELPARTTRKVQLPTTRTGATRSDVVASPSWPRALSPQQ